MMPGAFANIAATALRPNYCDRRSRGGPFRTFTITGFPTHPSRSSFRYSISLSPELADVQQLRVPAVVAGELDQPPPCSVPHWLQLVAGPSLRLLCVALARAPPGQDWPRRREAPVVGEPAPVRGVHQEHDARPSKSHA